MLAMAGTLTTASTLSPIIFCFLSQLATLQTLKDELHAAIPHPENVGRIPLPTLKALPYLTTVIKERLRLSYGASCRPALIEPDNATVFTDNGAGKKWAIPAKHQGAVRAC
ncbi:hypothetical protein AOQ84DRAFT_346653 [Glonium stellatum]|uniref:Uncharacterized protein n=1 Tax=Glonium stellatum TaxID=574774 RepID=A0A8E2JNV7_9PEZI|nr:hypothetical protein AOQ84DRAFT_346653 [Glonium stellatum]